MKIISRGAIKPKQVTITCYHCKSVLLVDEQDGKKEHDPWGNDSITVICPVCNNNIYIDYNLFH